MAGFERDVLVCENVNFNPSSAKPHSGIITLNGQLMIGSTGSPYIRAGFITSPDNSILVTNGPGTIKLQAGGTIATTYITDAGSTQPVSNQLTLIGAGGTSTSVGPGGTIVITGSPGGVTSIIGTANKISASSPTGAVTLSLIGPYTPATYTAHGVLIGEGTSSIVAVGPVASTGCVLQSNGVGSDPGFSTATYPITTTAYELLASTATNVIGGITAGTNGQLLIGSTGAVPVFATLTSTGGTITFTPGAGTLNLEASSGVTMVTTVFDSSGTWTKAAGVTQVLVLMWNGGGAGGSGRRSTTTASGGGGGGNNGFGLYWFGPSSFFDTSTTVTIGNGGTGGVGVAAGTDVNGNPGGNGGTTTLGNLSATTAGTSFGAGGTTTTAASGSVNGWRAITLNTPTLTGINAGIAGGAGGNVTGTNAASSGAVSNLLYIPSGGGGGSGADSGVARQAGNGGNLTNVSGTSILAGGAGGISTGTITGQPGNIGLVVGGTITGGTGGGGGGGMVAGTAGNGGVGGVPGGGGGGGGGSLNGTTSGAGGDGGKGRIIVIEYS